MLLGALGGCAAEFVHWLRLRRDGLPEKLDWVFVYATLGVIALGGIVGRLYYEPTMSALVIFHLGASAPVIVAGFVTTPPKLQEEFTAQASGSAHPSTWHRLRNWARW